MLRQLSQAREEYWWNKFAEEAEEAGSKVDSSRIFSTCKQLRNGREKARDGGTQQGVETPEEER